MTFKEEREERNFLFKKMIIADTKRLKETQMERPDAFYETLANLIEGCLAWGAENVSRKRNAKAMAAETWDGIERDKADLIRIWKQQTERKGDA